MMHQPEHHARMADLTPAPTPPRLSFKVLCVLPGRALLKFSDGCAWVKCPGWPLLAKKEST